jgi:hypothetical protein
MTLIAFAFLQHQRLATAKRGKKGQRTGASAEPTGSAAGHRRSPHARAPAASALPLLPTMDLTVAAQT